jgi:hypothetical protein
MSAFHSALTNAGFAVVGYGRARCTYTVQTAVGPNATLFDGVVGVVEVSETESMHGRDRVARRDVLIPAASVASPRLDATVTIDSDYWAVESIGDKLDGGLRG